MKKFFIAIVTLFLASGVFCDEWNKPVRCVDIGNNTFIEVRGSKCMCINVDQIKYISPYDSITTKIYITRNYMNEATECIKVGIPYADFINLIKNKKETKYDY